jgi:hypothetical protein
MLTASSTVQNDIALDPPPSLRAIPEGFYLDRDTDWTKLRLGVEHGSEARCFDLQGWTEMGRLIIDYRWLHGRSELQSEIIDRQNSIIDAADAESKAWKEAAERQAGIAGDAISTAEKASIAAGSADRRASRRLGLLIGVGGLAVIEAIIIGFVATR